MNPKLTLLATQFLKAGRKVLSSWYLKVLGIGEKGREGLHVDGAKRKEWWWVEEAGQGLWGRAEVPEGGCGKELAVGEQQDQDR